MVKLSLNEICAKLKHAGRLESDPLCVYGSETIPATSISSVSINRCIANAIYSLATNSEHSTIHFEEDSERKSCPGGQAWLGYKPLMPHLKYMLSTGTPDFRDGWSEFLIADPDLTEKRLKDVGIIKSLGKYTIISKDYQDIDEHAKIEMILCFGNAQQVRNLCSLFYFHSEQSHGIQVPWGPVCSSFVSYPAGLIENGPKNRVIVGPTDPTGNKWFPGNYMSIGIPYDIAVQMARDVESSFIGKHPKVAYPE
ncbi:MAG: DUF169 domain-containing protein [Candidatus Hodarchaeota archaeon]